MYRYPKYVYPISSLQANLAHKTSVRVQHAREIKKNVKFPLPSFTRVANTLQQAFSAELARIRLLLKAPNVQNSCQRRHFRSENSDFQSGDVDFLFRFRVGCRLVLFGSDERSVERR